MDRGKKHPCPQEARADRGRNTHAPEYRLVQSAADTQVWMIKEVGGEAVLGLVVVYVDDFLVAAPRGVSARTSRPSSTKYGICVKRS